MARGMSDATAKLQSEEHYLTQDRQALGPLADAQAARQMRAYMRDYARWNPQAVHGFVAEQRPRLSALSISEAMKRLQPACAG